MKIPVKRLTKEEYYLNIAKEVARRATCSSTHNSCLIVKDDQIISTGYNGAPRKTKDCYELGFCLRRKLGIASGTQYELCRSVHGEQNAIINAARAGVSVLGSDMYLFSKRVFGDEEVLVKAYPCFICKKMIINAGIKRVIGNDEKGKVVVHSVDEWVEDWAENDMIVPGNQQYSVNYGDTKKGKLKPKAKSRK